MTAPRKRRLRYSANAVIRKEAELLNISPEFSVSFFFNLMNRVVSSAMDNGECWVQGIGTFKRTEYAARRRHNPRTGSIDMIPAGEKITFHPIKPRKQNVEPALQAPAPVTEPKAPGRQRTTSAQPSVHRMK